MDPVLELLKVISSSEFITETVRDTPEVDPEKKKTYRNYPKFSPTWASKETV